MTLINKPAITAVSPALLDSNSTAPIWIDVTGNNFFKDAGLGHGSHNLECMVNNQSVELIFRNGSNIACLLQPSPDVKTYEIVMSTNFGS